MNEFENGSFVRKNGIWLVVLAAFIVFGFLLFKGWDKVVNQEIDGKMETVTGSFNCLPFKDGTSIDDTNCVLGVKSRDGFYYALDISHIQDVNTDLKVEDTIAVTGFIKPESEAATSQWTAFGIKGVIRVNTLLRTR
ncbi:MAG: hypothetical protein HYS51_02465 [Candidatus Zambryskibacteria bacterium]|nr:hypothetical protein [Candidatus Zambryskibacteria bacterium]